MNSIMRGFRLAQKLGTKVSRGIGQASAISRSIGQAAKDVRTIGQAANTALGGRFNNNRLYNKAMEVASQVEAGADKADRVAQAVGRELQ